MWFVRYNRQSDLDEIEEMDTAEQAVEIACLLVDEGCTVSGIGWGSLTVTVGKSEIAHLFAHWKRAKADRC
jgi:hypothetical protein